MHRSRDTFLFFFFSSQTGRRLQHRSTHFFAITSSLSADNFQTGNFLEGGNYLRGFFLWIFIYLESYEKKKDIE